MRVTNGITANNILDNILKSTQTLYTMQNQLSLGKKISKPSDDPTNINKIMQLNETISRLKQYQTNIANVKVNLDTIDGILYSLTTELNNVETTVSKYLNSAGGDYSAVLSSDIDNLFNSIMKMANSSLNGKYLFGGYNVATAPFEIIDNKIKYNGTDDQLLIGVGENENLESNITGIDLFCIHKMEATKYFNDPNHALYSQPSNNQIKITVGGNTTDITIEHNTSVGITLQNVVDSINRSGVDLTALVVKADSGYRLKLISKYVGQDGEIELQDSLPGGVFEKLGLVNSEGDFVGIQNNPKGGVLSTVLNIRNKILSGNEDIGQELSEFSIGRDNVIKAHSLVGIYTKRLEQRESYLTDLIIQQKTLTSNIEDIDYTELMMEYNQQMLAYHSALSVGANVMKQTLLDYL